jgi:hypothetical protein
VACSFIQKSKVPLPLEIIDVVGQLPCTDIRRAKVPVKLQVVLQTPALQTGVPPLAGHVLPHMPQLLTLSSAVSQPLARELSQSPNPVLQLGTQLDARQLVVPFALLQGAPHAPQWAVLVASATSQPLAGLLSQLPKPPLQPPTAHALPVQRGVPLAVLQRLPQKPQFVRELVMSVSHVTPRSLSHSPSPAPQGEAWQLPSTQICPVVPHAPGHEPQWVGSLLILVSQPFDVSPSQSA